MIDITNAIPKIIGAVVVINLITFAYIYILSQTELIKWDDKFNIIILLILNLLTGYIGIAISTRMYNYKTESKFIKIVIPVTFALEVIVISVILGRDQLGELFQKVR